MLFTIIITLLLLFLSGYFSASETSLFSIGREQFAALSAGDKKDVAIYNLLNRGEDTLIVILLANLMVNLFIISTLSSILTEFLNPSLFMKMIYSTAILLIFGEVIPKNIALGFSMKIARVSAPNLLFLLDKLAPVIGLFKNINRGLIRFNYRYILRKPRPFVTAEEYGSALKLSVEQGDISGKSAHFLGEFLNFSEEPLLQAAIHRSEVHKVYCDENSDSLEPLSVVYNRSEEVHALYVRGQEEEPLWYPSTGSIGDFLSFLKDNKRRSALLLDEYGSYYGVATISSVLAYWKATHQPEKCELQSIVLEGTEPVAQYRRWFPEDMVNTYPDIKTVNGLVTSWFGKIPHSGAVLTLESCIFHVIKSNGRKILTIKIEKRG